MDAGYEIWYGVTEKDLREITGKTVDEVIDMAAAKIGERVSGEREFFATRKDGYLRYDFVPEVESVTTAHVLYGPKASEQGVVWGFGVELLDADWDFEPKRFPQDLPDALNVGRAREVFRQFVEMMFDEDIAECLSSAANTYITPYYL